MKKLILSIAFILIGLTVSAQSLTAGERSTWNGFVTYLGELRGSTKLDNHELSKKLFNEYTGGKIDYTSFVTRVQTDLLAYRNKALQQIKSGKAVFVGSESEFMPGLSIIDGWAGSKTTNYKFPADTVIIYKGKSQGGVKSNDTY